MSASTIAGVEGPLFGSYDGPLAAEIDYPDVGVVLEPPGDRQPTFLASDLRSLCDSGAAMCPIGMTAHISLALATANNSGDMQPDGSLLPRLNRMLVYTLTWDDIPCLPASVIPNADGSSPPVKEYRCLQFTFVDAHTGTVPYAFSSSKP